LPLTKMEISLLLIQITIEFVKSTKMEMSPQLQVMEHKVSLMEITQIQNLIILLGLPLTKMEISLLLIQITMEFVKSTKNGNITTIAGDGTKFNHPCGIAIDKDGNIIVADSFNHRIHQINKNGNVIIIAGDGTQGFFDGNHTNSKFNYPCGVAVDKDGNIIVADSFNHRIRQINKNGSVTTIGGNGFQGYEIGPNFNSKFNFPRGVAIDDDGNVIVADYWNNRIRKIIQIGCWPISHNLLPFDIQNSIQETLQILKTVHNLPKELNTVIILLVLNILLLKHCI